MNRPLETFDDEFATLTGFAPFPWQRRLFQCLANGDIPAALDLPTGLGKTSVMTIWLIARAHGANLPRRLVYVVDRRAVVDQATEEAEKLRGALDGQARHFSALDNNAAVEARMSAAELKRRLGLEHNQKLAISTLRGAFADNREWLIDPSVPAIIVGTVDMIGSRLLFEGYGASRRMRPYQAGFLGIDALMVLDEAHLAPPFAHLLRTIEQGRSLRPAGQADRALLPRFVFLPLSATLREARTDEQERPPFRLEQEDRQCDPRIKKRLDARKALRLEPLKKQNPDRQLAEAAWALAQKDDKPYRVVVFCTRRDKRDKEDDGSGPSVQGVKEEIEKLAKGDRKSGRAATDIHPPELLVGARRVWEREAAAQCLRKLGFLGTANAPEKPAFLLATSAGEVGVDIDADHMVSDLAAWERMVQRLGRVNRRGEGAADIAVFWSEPTIKDANKPTAMEKRASIALASKSIIESLPAINDAYDASSGALHELAQTARRDDALNLRITAATTPEPLYPALSRALVDAWSMTSLETHTGRPRVAPWLRGWDDETPQTTIIWRTHLPIRISSEGRETPVDGQAIAQFFDAAPPHQSEKLETETYRVAAWLEKRARMLLGRKKRHPKEDSAGNASGTAPTSTDDETLQFPAGQSSANDAAEDEDAGHQEEGQEAPGSDNIADEPPEPAASGAGTLQLDAVVALILNPDAEYAGQCYTLRNLMTERKGRAKDAFESQLQGKILVVDQRFGGLDDDGLLDEEANNSVETADTLTRWSRTSGFRVRRSIANPEEPSPDPEWRFEYGFASRRNENGDGVEWLVVEYFTGAPQSENARSISWPQELAEHQAHAAGKMRQIAKAVGLPDSTADALARGAVVHDEGKRAARWQRAFKAERDARRCHLTLPLAKTRGPIDQQILGRYRHELGSLLRIDQSAQLVVAVPDEWRDLVLHLIAAHHGQARPAITTLGCDDGPSSLLEAQAAAIALRFARLQKRWGPWGLAWWEALMRAADQQASRDNDAHQVSIAAENTP